MVNQESERSEETPIYYVNGPAPSDDEDDDEYEEEEYEDEDEDEDEEDEYEKERQAWLLLAVTACSCVGLRDMNGHYYVFGEMESARTALATFRDVNPLREWVVYLVKGGVTKATYTGTRSWLLSVDWHCPAAEQHHAALSPGVVLLLNDVLLRYVDEKDPYCPVVSELEDVSFKEAVMRKLHEQNPAIII